MAKTRITLSLDEDLVSRFQGCADKEGRSLSSTVNSWLVQILPGAEWVASVAEDHKDVTRETVQQVIESVTRAQEETVRAMIKAKGGGLAGARARAALAAVPPSCNTGGKFTKVVQPKSKGAGRGHH